MRIVGVDIIDVDQRAVGDGTLNPVIVRIRSDAGVEGFGEVGLAYGCGAKAGAAMVAELAAKFLIGADPFRIDHLQDTLFRLSLWAQGGGPVIYGAMSAIDIALNDLKARALGVPVYDLIGGLMHDSLPVYANAWFYGSASPQEHARAAREVVAKGYRALKFDPLKRAPDGSPDRPRRHLPGDRLHFGIALTESVREAIGSEVDLWIDLHANLGPASAIAFISAIAHCRPAYVEEPVDATNVECMKQVRSAVTVPLAAGERLYLRTGFRPYIESQCLDLIQPDVGLAGGISETRRIAAQAEIYGIPIQPHNCASPLLTAASLQVAAACPNAIAMEVFPFRKDGHYAMVENPLERRISGGRLTVPSTPGLGVEVDSRYLDRFVAVTVGRARETPYPIRNGASASSFGSQPSPGVSDTSTVPSG
jgi:galactonate dehydratase